MFGERRAQIGKQFAVLAEVPGAASGSQFAHEIAKIGHDIVDAFDLPQGAHPRTDRGFARIVIDVLRDKVLSQQVGLRFEHQEQCPVVIAAPGQRVELRFVNVGPERRDPPCHLHLHPVAVSFTVTATEISESRILTMGSHIVTSKSFRRGVLQFVVKPLRTCVVIVSAPFVSDRTRSIATRPS